MIFCFFFKILAIPESASLQSILCMQFVYITDAPHQPHGSSQPQSDNFSKRSLCLEINGHVVIPTVSATRYIARTTQHSQDWNVNIFRDVQMIIDYIDNSLRKQNRIIEVLRDIIENIKKSVTRLWRLHISAFGQWSAIVVCEIPTWRGVYWSVHAKNLIVSFDLSQQRRL